MFSLQVKTHQSTELLIQSENDGVINDWYRALMDTISTHVSLDTHTHTHTRLICTAVPHLSTKWQSCHV